MKKYSTKTTRLSLLSGLLLVVFVLNVFTAPEASVHAHSGSTAKDYQTFFDAVLPDQLSSEHIVGATAAVVENGELVFAKGYGFADIDDNIPVTADETLFFIGSDGKLFTWTAVMQLVEQGKLDLYADINGYLDFEIPAAFTEPVTMHHLMTHTAGFEEQFNSLLLDDPSKILPLRAHLLRYMPERVYPPGAVSAYSNYGTALAGYIIERISGQSYEDYLNDHLLVPLGMTRSFTGNTVPEAFSADLSMGYKFRNGSHEPLAFEWTSAVPMAPIRTTVTDLSRFMIAHLNGGCVDETCILSADTLQTMHSSQFTHHPQMTGMAYGFLEMPFNGQRVLWHMGESARFITVLALIPEQNIGLVVSYNTPPANGRDILVKFMDAFFPVEHTQVETQPLAGWEERSAAFNGTYVNARSARTTAQILARYSGTIPVAAVEGKLSFGGWTFVESEPNIYRQVGGDRTLAFEQGEDGRHWLFMGPLAYFKLAWYETPLFLMAVMGLILLVFLSAFAAGLAVLFRKPNAGGENSRAAWLISAGLGLFNVGLTAWFIMVLIKLSDQYVYNQPAVTVITALFWLAVPWTAAVLALAVRAWITHSWSLPQRIHYSLAAIASTVFLWLAWTFNLIGR